MSAPKGGPNEDRDNETVCRGAGRRARRHRRRVHGRSDAAAGRGRHSPGELDVDQSNAHNLERDLHHTDGLHHIDSTDRPEHPTGRQGSDHGRRD